MAFKITTLTVEFVDPKNPELKMTKSINISDLSTQKEIDARIKQHQSAFEHRISIGLIKPPETLEDTSTEPLVE